MKKSRRSGRFALALFLMSLGATTAWTEEASEAVKSPLRQWAERDYFLGDWGGVRTNLSRRGVDFEFFIRGVRRRFRTPPCSFSSPRCDFERLAMARSK